MQIFIAIIIIVAIIIPIYLVTILYKIKKTKERIDWINSQRFTTLRIDVPRNNDKMPLAAEQLFAAIHGIYSENSAYQPHIGFEIVAKDKFIQFYIHTPIHLRDFVEGQVYAQYPTVEINEVEDYAKDIKVNDISFAVTDLTLTKPDVYPIKCFDSFEVDPLSGITSVMSKLEHEEQVWFQLIIRPVGDEWQDKGNSIVSSVRAGKKPGGQGMITTVIAHIANFMGMFVRQAINPSEEKISEGSSAKSEVKLPSTVEEALSGIEKKIVKLGFETKIRILCIAKDPTTASVKCKSVGAAFKQYNTTNLNGFIIGDIATNNIDKWQEYVHRSFENYGNIFNIAELASVYHLPNESVETPNIVWTGAKKGEPPANLPLTENTPDKDLTVIGMTNFRNVSQQFGIKIDDRKRHVYIIGKSGTGKSTLIENMAVDDIVEGRGVIIVDPHGELADKALACVPDNRVEDVVIFDPSDRAYPIGFNLLEQVEDDFKGMVASGFVGIFKKIFGDSWGPRLEHILRNTVLALLDNPNSTMLDIPKMLTDNRFRDKVVENVKDTVIKEFWVNEFAQYDAKFRTEAVSPILNKVGQFLATATIRNIVGQAHSKINIREIMDQEKILIINLSRGKIGEDNSALLGAMMITKIQLSAMSRADVTIDKRPESFLYVDEFQNFATDSFSVILSEARKYNLALTMANQYVEQLPEEVRSAVFGNAGTIISFRVGGSDADFLVKEFEPVFETNDMVNLDKFHIYIKLLVDGMSAPAFSARTLPPVQKLTGNVEKIVDYTHEHYSTSRAVIEEEINKRSKEEEEELRKEAEAYKKGGLEGLMAQKSGGTVKASITEKVEKTEDKKFEPARGEQQKIDQEKNNVGKTSLPRSLKYKNIIGENIYKEQTTKGGVKWYIGEKLNLDKVKEMGIDVTDSAKKMTELAKRVEGKKPVSDNHDKENASEKTDNQDPKPQTKSTQNNRDATSSKKLSEGEEVKIEE